MSKIDISKTQSKSLLQSQQLMTPIKIAPQSYADILKKGTMQRKPVVSPVPLSESPFLSQISSSSSTTASDSLSDNSSDNSSDGEVNSTNLISTEKDFTYEESNLDSSKSESSDFDSPILKCGHIDVEEFDILNLGKSAKTKKSHSNETDFLNPNWKLPGGKKYQRDGVRLENAFYNGLSKTIKSNISTNVQPRYSNGNAIVEFDMIYRSDSSKRIVSFEIKGVNSNTINNLVRQQRLIAQGVRQKEFLKKNFSDYTVDCIYCFVTGKIKNETIEESNTSEWVSVTIVKPKPVLDPEFIKKIKSKGISVAIGETPQQCAKNALIMLNLLK